MVRPPQGAATPFWGPHPAVRTRPSLLRAFEVDASDAPGVHVEHDPNLRCATSDGLRPPGAGARLEEIDAPISVPAVSKWDPSAKSDTIREPHSRRARTDGEQSVGWLERASVMREAVLGYCAMTAPEARPHSTHRGANVLRGDIVDYAAIAVSDRSATLPKTDVAHADPTRLRRGASAGRKHERCHSGTQHKQSCGPHGQQPIATETRSLDSRINAGIRVRETIDSGMCWIGPNTPPWYVPRGLRAGGPIVVLGGRCAERRRS